jgi:hypothetical protein
MLFTKFNCEDEVKLDEIGGTRNRHGEKEECM